MSLQNEWLEKTSGVSVNFHLRSRSVNVFFFFFVPLVQGERVEAGGSLVVVLIFFTVQNVS